MHSMNLSPIPRHDSKPKFTLCWACKGCELRPPMWVYKNGCVAKLKKVKHIEPKKTLHHGKISLNLSTIREDHHLELHFQSEHHTYLHKKFAKPLQKLCRNPAETQILLQKPRQNLQKLCRNPAESVQKPWFLQKIGGFLQTFRSHRLG